MISAAIPAPYRERGQIAYETGKRIVEMVREDLKPSDIMTRDAFLNAIVANSAIGGSSNAPIHLSALSRHIGVDLPLSDWQEVGHDVPLLVTIRQREPESFTPVVRRCGCPSQRLRGRQSKTITHRLERQVAGFRSWDKRTLPQDRRMPSRSMYHL